MKRMMDVIRVALLWAVALPALFSPTVLAQTDPARLQEQLDFANGLFHRGFFEEAMEEYERFLKQGPQAAEAPMAWLRLGRSAMTVKQYEKAVEAFQKAEQATADAALKLEAVVSRAEALYFLSRHAEAVSLLEGITASEATSGATARALFYLARAQHASGAPAKAETTYEKLAARFPDAPETAFGQYQLGFLQVELGDMEGAALAFSAVANDPRADAGLRMESRFRAAEIYDKLGWTTAALGAYEQLRTEFPDSEYARRADYGYAWALYHSGKYVETEAVVDAFLSAYADSPHTPGLRYLKGNCLHQQRRHDDALKIYQQVREKHPDSPFAARALYKSAWSHHLKGNTAEARAAALAFLDGHPDSDLSGEAVFLLGQIRVAEGNYEEALKEFRLVAEKHPNSEFGADALFKAAECYAQLGLRDEAARQFEEFARRYPDHELTRQAILRSGDAHFSERDFEEALANYARILEKPGDPAVEEDTLYRMAITYHNMRRGADSAKTFRQLLEKFPEGRHAAMAHYRLGEFELYENKDPLKAIEAYRAALGRQPDPDLAGNALQGLALAFYEQKDHEQAAGLFLQLAREYPRMALPAEVYLWSGQWFYEKEQWGDAAAMLQAMLRSHPAHAERPRVLLLAGKALERGGEADAALKLFEECVKTGAAAAADAAFQVAEIWRSRNDTGKAMAFYEQAANLEGGEISARARFQLGLLYETAGDHENAARSFMRMAILFVHETLSPEALWRAAQNYEALGNKAQAASIYNELVADYPQSSFTEQARAALTLLEPAQAAPDAPPDGTE